MNFLIMLEESQDGPSSLRGNALECRAGIGGHGVADTLEQGQVVRGIAVEQAALEALQGQPFGSQPVLDARDLALAKRGHASDGARGLPLRITRQLGRNQRFDAQRLGNRPGDEVIGRGHQGQAVALLAVALHQGLRGGFEHRLHHLAQEAPADLCQLGLGAPAPGRGGKVHIGVHIQ
jgi:hypothetical protein